MLVPDLPALPAHGDSPDAAPSLDAAVAAPTAACDPAALADAAQAERGCGSAAFIVAGQSGTRRREARGSRDAAQARRLPAPAAIDEGGTRGEAATIDWATLPSVRDRAAGFNAEGPVG